MCVILASAPHVHTELEENPVPSNKDGGNNVTAIVTDQPLVDLNDPVLLIKRLEQVQVQEEPPTPNEPVATSIPTFEIQPSSSRIDTDRNAAIHACLAFFGDAAEMWRCLVNKPNSCPQCTFGSALTWQKRYQSNVSDSLQVHSAVSLTKQLVKHK